MTSQFQLTDNNNKKKFEVRNRITRSQSIVKVSALPFTQVLLDAQLELLALHFLNLLIVELVPVVGASVSYVSDVVAGVGADATVNQHGAQLVCTLLL